MDWSGKIRCSCCNRVLSDYESTARHAETGTFLDTCLVCLKEIGIPVNGRKDLDPENTGEDDDYKESHYEYR